MSSKVKLSRDQERLHDLFLGEYLGLGDISKLDNGPNPFDFKSREDIENPHIHLLKIIRNPKYLAFTCKHIFNIELAPFQLVILQELWHRKYPMLIASRGASKSFLLALYAMVRALITQGCKIVIVGAAFRQAKVVFEYCEAIWHNAPILRSLVGIQGRSGPKRDIDRCLCIIGDSLITALPLGDGTKIRGQRANYIIADEFASIPREIYENVVSGFAAVSASPIESMKNAARIRVLRSLGYGTQMDEQEEDPYGNQAIIAGTAYYGFNHFAEYYNQYRAIIKTKGDRAKLEEIFKGEIPAKFNHRDFCVIKLPVELLPEGFMDEKHVARSRATVHSGIYNMEFGACFVTDSNGFYKRTLIETCVAPVDVQGYLVNFRAMLRGNPKKKYIFGVDPASESDNFAIYIIEINENHRRIVYGWTTTKASYRELLKTGTVNEQDYYRFCARKIRDLMKVFPCERIAMDSQGGGIPVAEALHDSEKLEKGEQPIWPIIEEDDEKDTDGEQGLHILELVNFADAKYTQTANHGLRKDFEDKVLLFPFYDTLAEEEAIAMEKQKGQITDTLSEAMAEIEELKSELTTIVHTQTGVIGRDHWDTPETKLPGNKKGRLRKDRYSALLMANMSARTMERALQPPEYVAVGGIARSNNSGGSYGQLYKGPSWFVNAVAGTKYGAVVKKGVS